MKPKLDAFMKVAKKQGFSLTCAGVALLAIILTYWPTKGLYQGLLTKLNTSAGQAGSLATLSTHERHFPNLSVDATSAPALDFYPTRDVIDAGTAAVKKFGDQSQQLLSTANELNARPALVDAALPAGDDIARANFGKEFIAAVTDDNRIRNWPSAFRAGTGANAIPPLLAGRRVSEADIQNALNAKKAEIDERTLAKDANGAVTPDSAAAAAAYLAAQTRDTVLEKETEEAKKIRVYLEPGAIKPPQIFTAFQQAQSSMSPSDIWTAQLWLWVNEDMATAVARANADAHDVTDAAVKQIISMDVKDPPYLVSGDPTTGKEDSALTYVYDATPSGRVSNGMYDVVQFKLGLDVDANRVVDVLSALEKGQFVTVLSVQASTVDPAELAIKRFIYGKAPVVHLDVVCEELLLHQWLSKIQPPDTGAAKTLAAGAAGTAMTPFFTIVTHTGN